MRCVVDAWRRHLPSLKLAFRMFTLLGAADDNPSDMSLSQFRRFVGDTKVRARD